MSEQEPQWETGKERFPSSDGDWAYLTVPTRSGPTLYGGRLSVQMPAWLAERIVADHERITTLEQELEAARRDAEALATALEFYAVREAYLHDDGECPAICEDEGDKAREALTRHAALEKGTPP